MLTDERLVLIGDAGHGIHPIAGQGLNLGFRDVAALVEVLVEGKRLGLDPGDAQLLARYQRWRSLDTLMVAAATDSLTRLFGVPGKTASAVRRFGISTVDRIPALKQRFMAEARGESGALPKLLAGDGRVIRAGLRALQNRLHTRSLPVPSANRATSSCDRSERCRPGGREAGRLRGVLAGVC